MKSRITAKFLVVAALLVLVINVFSSFGSLFVQAQTTSSGYKVDVTYQEGSAKLTGNPTDVLQGYQLTSLTDDSTGQQYDPSKFSMEVTKNGTYTFTLGYTLKGISTQTQSEKITVMVDKLATGDATKVADTGVMSVSTLESRATTNQDVTVGVYPYENFSSTDSNLATKIKNITVSSGIFEDEVDSINNQLTSLTPKREYYAAYLKRSGDGKEVPIIGVWKNTGTDGKTHTFYAIKDSGSSKDNTLGIAYQASDNDEIRIYGKIVSTISYNLNSSNLSQNGISNLNIAPNLSEYKNQISPGTQVIVSLNWSNNIQSVDVKYGKKGSGESFSLSKRDNTETQQGYDEYARRYVGTFTMPSYDTVLTITINSKSSERWIGIYDSSSVTFQACEIGYTRVGIGTGINQNSNVSAMSSYSQVRRNQGDISATSYSYNALSSDQGFRTSKAGQQSITGVVDGSSQSYPVEDYSVGSKIVAKYESRRSAKKPQVAGLTWWAPNPDFEYNVPLQGRIDIFYQQGIANTDKYQSEYFKLYQTKEEYDKSVSAGIKYDSSYTMLSGSNTAGAQGLYPVQTVLENGIKVTSYPGWYNTSSIHDDYGSLATYLKIPALYYSFVLVVENSYDDIRLVLGDGTSTLHRIYQASGGNGVSEVTGRGDANDKYDPKANPIENRRNVSVASPANGDRSPKISDYAYTYYHVKTKDGYSVPLPTMTVRDPQTSQQYTVSKVESNVTGGTIDSSTYNRIGDSFMAGIPQNTGYNGYNSATPFYTSSDGCFHYSLFVRQNGGSIHSITFTSSPITFKVSYNQGSITEEDHNVDSSNYFSVSQIIPNLSDGTYFKGWKLYAEGEGIGTSGKVQLKSGSKDNGGLYAPGDLISVSDLYKELKSQLTNEAVGQTQITLKFELDSDKEIPPGSGKAVVNEYLQKDGNSYSDSAANSATFQLLKGANVQITGVRDTFTKDSSIYYKNEGKSSSTYIESFTPSNDGSPKEVASIKYDKGIAVQYKNGIDGGSVSNSHDTFSYHTTVTGNNNQITMPSGDELSSMGVHPEAGKQYGGWEVTTNNSGSQTVLKQYPATSTSDTVKVNLADSEVANQAFTDGRVIIRPIWKTSVAAIQNDQGRYGITQTTMESQGKWAYTKKSFDVSATFTYVGGDNTSYQNAKSNNQIYYALYKLNPGNKGSAVGTGNYQLWYSSKSGIANGQNGKVAAPTLSESLVDGKFTITFTITDSSGSIDYQWDNNAKYAIVAWSSANGSEGCFNVDGSITTSGTFSDSSSFNKIPITSTLTRVLEPLKITATGSSVSGNRINARKILYNDQTFGITYEVTTGQSMLTQAEAQQEFNIAVGKQDPGSSKPIQLWYGSKSFSDYVLANNGFTDQGGLTSGVKMNTPTITLKGGSNNKSNTFTISVTGIKDTSPASPEWQSEAKYYAYAWNGANTTPLTVAKDPQKPKNYSVNNDSLTDAASKVYTTYIINDNGVSGSKNVNATKESDGKAFYGTVSYPANINVQENTSTKKLESSLMKVQLNAVWVGSDMKTVNTNNGTVTPVSTTQPVEHDFSYGVTLTGGNVSSDTSGTKVRLTQATTSQSVDAKILTSTGGVVKNGSLGTLDFYANKASGVQELGFKLQTDSIPSSLTKDVFSGTIGYSFIRNDLTGGGST